MKPSDALKRRIGILEERGPIDPNSVDYTTKNADLVRREIGPVFPYFQRVEGEVDGGYILDMLPMLNPWGQKFLNAWVPEEQRHSQIISSFCQKLEIDNESPQIEDSPKFKIMGIAGHMSESIHEVFEMIYLTRGAMHERLTLIGYDLLLQRLEGLGELALEQTMIKPIRTQEAGHLGYYRLAATELKSRLSTWQLWLARYLSKTTYAPVGASTADQKADMGVVLSILAGTDIEQFADPVQKIANELLSEGNTILPKFVLRSMQRCMEVSQDTIAA